MELQHYSPAGDTIALFSNSCLSPMRRKLVKFHHRIVRMAKRYDLTVDEMYTIWFDHIRVMSNRSFWELWKNNGNCFDPNMREELIIKVRKLTLDK